MAKVSRQAFFEVLGEQAVKDCLGVDWGAGVTQFGTALSEQGGKAITAKQQSAADTATLNKMKAADEAWAQAEQSLELAQNTELGRTKDLNQIATASVVRDQAKNAAFTAAASLSDDLKSKRCQAANDALKQAALTLQGDPKNSSKLAAFHAWQKVASACGGGSGDGGGFQHLPITSSGNFFTAVHGGLPVWGWGLIGIGGAGALWMLLKRR